MEAAICPFRGCRCDTSVTGRLLLEWVLPSGRDVLRTTSCGIDMRTRSLAIATMILVSVARPAPAQVMNCPFGTYPWRDDVGNATCRSFQTQQDVITQPKPFTSQPNGSSPSTDPWGNSTSQGEGSDAGATYRNDNQGCPVGTSPWVDNVGHRACRHY
jgi:hypothetical protein